MNTFKDRYIAARKTVIALSLSKLNDRQKEAAMASEGPLLILAGAGSGKTTVLIHRIACLLRFGRAADSEELPPFANEEALTLLERYIQLRSPEDKEAAEKLCALDTVAPWQIIAITFTNKAAGELVSRLRTMLGEAAEDIWAATFHSACVRILRKNTQYLGLNGQEFTIYDTADSLSLIKRILKDMELDEKSYAPRNVLSTISAAKNAMTSPDEFRKTVGADIRRQKLADIYSEYRKRMLQSDAMDFDDLILNTVLLLEDNAELRDYYQRRFKYVLVDEYQDTNLLQYKLVRLLAGERKNICVVGDDDQGIYKFRGATIENILDFEKDFSGARVIKLEQNYRSTGNILAAANAVIAHNQSRKDKTLWTSNDMGAPITLYSAMNENDEAQYIAGQILAGYTESRRWSDFAVLYRVNALSNRLEYALKRNGIPYRVFGGTRFYDRAEVKDMLAYLCVVSNPGDNLRLRRIINHPPRGIGETAVERIAGIASQENVPLFEVMKKAENYAELHRSLNGIKSFVDMIEELRQIKSESLVEMYDVLLRKSGYIAMLEEKDTQENITRLENVQELKTNLISFVNEREGNGILDDFLSEMALYSDTDDMDAESDCVSLMTIHSAKGLEFPTVFLSGAEDGLFPGAKALGDTDELEEERRLCYVAITRAGHKLYITNARQRMLFGKTQNNMVSRFIRDIPDTLLLKLPKREERFGGEASQRSSFMPRYTKPAAKPAPKPMKGPVLAQTPAISVRAGDMITHKAFGDGTVLTVTPMGPDSVLEIAFEKEGTKKLMLSTAGKFLRLKQ